MKWEQYKLLTKSEREEYDFKFKDEDGVIFGNTIYWFTIGFVILFSMNRLMMEKMGLDTTGFFEVSMEILVFLGFIIGIDMMYLLIRYFLKTAWLKKHFKVVHK